MNPTTYQSYNLNFKELLDNFNLDQFIIEHAKIAHKNPFRKNAKETVIIFNRPVELHTFIKRKDTYLFITDIHSVGNDHMVDGYVLTQEQYRHYVLTELLDVSQSDYQLTELLGEGETDNV